MKKLFDHKFFQQYTNAEWIILKISFCWCWVGAIGISTFSHESVPYPSGICSLFDCSFLVTWHIYYGFYFTTLLLALLYILEKKMVVVTSLMCLMSLVVFTLEESSGILNRNTLYTLIFLVQAVAYFRNSPSHKTERIQFPIQMIAAGYMLAGISKLTESGLGWITDAPLASIQIIKNYGFSYFDTGDISFLNEGLSKVDVLLAHPFFAKLLFAFTLFLELFAWLAVKNKLRSFIYGLLLTSMHIGILYFMNIFIEGIFYPMFIFMVNPFYLLYFLSKGLYKKSGLQLHHTIARKFTKQV